MEENRRIESGAVQPQGMTLVQGAAKETQTETEYTKRLKENWGVLGPATFLYAVFYAFCMFRNGSGITFPFFIAASLLFLCLCLSKLEITLRKGSVFYMVGMMLLAVSTFCTDDGRIIFMNKTGIFLLVMSLLLKQFFDTDKWKLGKYLGGIFSLVFASLGNIHRAFADGAAYYRKNGRKNKKLWSLCLGVLIAMPLLFVVLLLLAGADAVFRQMTNQLLEGFRAENVFNVLFRIAFLFMASYQLLSYLCEKKINEKVYDGRTGEPILAITITTMLSVVYLLFSGIQIVYLFLGKMQLPEGYTYAMYAREGFFQLLAVSILNLVIVLICLGCFRESEVLKIVLTVMSLCTFVMIASSALRMVIYIRYYYLTFLRILVLWALALLAVLFVGVIIGIYKENFGLFRYCMAVVTILYTVLAFSHPDYIIAKVNVENTVAAKEFFQSETPYHDYRYLSGLCADAAPILIPYLEELGYNLNAFYEEDVEDWVYSATGEYPYRKEKEGFGYYYLGRMQTECEDFGVRTYNISRHMAQLQIAECID